MADNPSGLDKPDSSQEEDGNPLPPPAQHPYRKLPAALGRDGLLDCGHHLSSREARLSQTDQLAK